MITGRHYGSTRDARFMQFGEKIQPGNLGRVWTCLDGFIDGVIRIHFSNIAFDFSNIEGGGIFFSKKERRTKLKFRMQFSQL